MRAWSVLPLLLVLLMSACGGGEGQPDQAAERWFDALTEGNEGALRDLTCAAQRESVTGVTGLLAGVGEGTVLDLSGLDFKTTEQGGDTASVQVTGLIKITYLGQKLNEEIDEAISMVKEDGTWKVCEE